MCVVLSGFILCTVYTIEISVTPLKMGDGLITESKRNNSTFIMLYLYHVMDVDYLVVGEMINIKNCLITLACVSTCCVGIG
jgi:hypothetical protein